MAILAVHNCSMVAMVFKLYHNPFKDINNLNIDI